MDHLREIVLTLSNEDSAAFELFIQRLKKKSQRKDLALYKILREEMALKPKEVIDRLYASPNKEAYHAVRKRLRNHLIDFILLKNSKGVSATEASTLGNFGLAHYLFEQDRPLLAWKYLEKAEAGAIAFEQHDALLTIYNLMITKAELIEAVDLKQIIERHGGTQRKADEDQRANIALALVKQELNKARQAGNMQDIEQKVEAILDAHQLNVSIATRPRLAHDLAVMVRSAMLATKQFHRLEPFLLRHYNSINKRRGFKPSELEYQLNLAYMLAHTLYRNKKFDAALKQLNTMEVYLAEGTQAIRNRFVPRWAQLKAAIFVFQNRLHEAIEMLEQLLSNKRVHLSAEAALNAILNTGIYHFHMGNVKAAHKSLLRITHSDTWCEKQVGPEWVMKKNIMEAILFTDLELGELAESRIRSVERKYKYLFDQAIYGRVKTYLQLIKRVINDSTIATTASFHQEVEKSFDWIPSEQEDIQAIGFYAWLKSKMTNTPYHQVLMDLVR